MNTQPAMAALTRGHSVIGVHGSPTLTVGDDEVSGYIARETGSTTAP